jgi:hypothetical protein
MSTAGALMLLLVEVEVNLRPTVSRPVCLGAGNPSAIRDKFFFSPRNFL